MIKAIYGKDKILMFRLLENATKEKATKLALQTEHTLSYENNVDTTQTKDGAITSNGGIEVSLEINAIASHDEVNEMLKKSVIEQKVLECWEIDLAGEAQEGKYPAKYMQGKLESWEMPANVEDLAEISTTMKIDGIPQDGFATISKDQEKAILYAFRDVTIFDDKAETTGTEGHA
ncbi:MAG: phage major tail protein, TP901-1 family [Anaerococcus obesiensis]|uniref:Major tail protein n=1 Tax=Firmicutes phage HS08 TaxID=3056391 RepID=A0AA50AFD0_9VIRU|nr:MAG: major tail protein [Firmicutes phage HS08]